MKPAIPYVELPELVLLPAGTFGPGSSTISVKPFGVLVAVGVYAGAALALAYGRRRGLAGAAVTSFIVWVVAFGFVFGHVLDVVFYSPSRVLSDPWSLLRLYDGLSSYGGFVGGVLGAFAWKLRHRTPVLPYADVVASALPAGWVFGRMGCAVVHDHLGVRSEAWFAVAFPDGGRIDLGLVEMALTVPIAAAFLALRRNAFPWGFFACVLALVYAPLRFALDFWRLGEPERSMGVLALPDARYAGLTPAQWASLALGAFGVVLAFRVFDPKRLDSAFLPPPVPASIANRSDADPERTGQDTRAER